MCVCVYPQQTSYPVDAEFRVSVPHCWELTAGWIHQSGPAERLHVFSEFTHTHTHIYVRHSLVRTLLQVSSKHRSTVLHSLCHWCINLMLYLCSLKHTLTPCLLYHSPPPLSSAVLNPSPPPPGLPSADNSVPSRCFCPRYQLFLHGIIRHNWFKYRKATSFCLHSVWTEHEKTRTCLCVHVCSTPMEACMDTRHEFN